MKFFQKMSIDQFVRQIIQDDRETNRMIESWNMEKDEIIQLVTEHFREYGIFMVSPMSHARLIYKHIQQHLIYSPKIRSRLNKIEAEIAKAKARHTRHDN